MLSIRTCTTVVLAEKERVSTVCVSIACMLNLLQFLVHVLLPLVAKTTICCCRQFSIRWLLWPFLFCMRIAGNNDASTLLNLTQPHHLCCRHHPLLSFFFFFLVFQRPLKKATKIPYPRVKVCLFLWFCRFSPRTRWRCRWMLSSTTACPMPPSQWPTWRTLTTPRVCWPKPRWETS